MAVLGILVMNAVSYGPRSGSYFNLSAGGSMTRMDWLIGGFGKVFFDQQFIGLSRYYSTRASPCSVTVMIINTNGRTRGR